MKDWKLILIGCAIGTVCSTTTAWLVTSRPVEAQAQGPFTRCIMAYQESVDTNNEGRFVVPELNHTVLIPPGWEPIGGSVGQDSGGVVLCHR